MGAYEELYRHRYMALSYGVSSTNKPTLQRLRKATYMIPYPSLRPNTLIAPTYIRDGHPYGMICQKLNSNNIIHIDGLVFDHDSGAGSGADVSIEISVQYKTHGGTAALYIIGTLDLSQYAKNALVNPGSPLTSMTCVIVDKSLSLDGIPDVDTGFILNIEQQGGTSTGNEFNLQFGIY